MKYKANFSVNNGTTLINGIESNNLRIIIKEIRGMMLRERFMGNQGCWWMVDSNDLEIASGGITREGEIYRNF
jgi:hypothetical protein